MLQWSRHRASHLRSLEVPAFLQEAAANVLATWPQAAELPTAESEKKQSEDKEDAVQPN